VKSIASSIVSSRRRRVLSLFIAFHLICLFIDLFSISAKLKPPAFVDAYVSLFGLYQNWSMFERVPAANYYLCAVITSKDGKKNFVEFEHMDKLDYWSRLKLHRFRKFQQSSIFNSRNAYLYPQVCKWIMLQQEEKVRTNFSSIILYQKEVALLSKAEKMHPFFKYSGEF
jgi:hypothetical protein